MKKLYQKYFEITDDKKITDAVFKTRITMLICAMLACSVVMVSSAFALFSSDVNNTTVLKSAVWDIYAVDSAGNDATSGYICPAVPDDIHIFNISGSGGASGYCIITITSPENTVSVYNTSKFDSYMQIEIQAAAGCRIDFTPHWGDPSNFGVFTTFRTIYHSQTPVEYTDEGEVSGETGDGSTPQPSDSESSESSSSDSSDNGSSEPSSSDSSDSGSSESSSSDSSDSGSSESSSSDSSDSGSSEPSSSGSSDSGSSSAPSSSSSSDSASSTTTSSSSSSSESGSSQSSSNSGE